MNAQAKKVSGKDLMIFVGGKALALVTDTTINMKADTEDNSTKDDGSEGNEDISKTSWDASSESYYSADDRTADVVGAELMRKFWAKEPVDVVFGQPINIGDKEVPTEGWTVPSTNGWKGKALITSFSIKATNGQKATCSLGLQGKGKLEELARAK